MRKAILLFLFNSFFFYTQAQDTLDVVDKKIKIGGTATVTEYYGFADGDKIIFSLNVDGKKELKDVTISEYAGNVKFADHQTQKIENKTLNIYRNAVYSFEYYNSNLSGRNVEIKIQRIPKSEKTKFFNTNVKWINKVDTSYSAKQNTYLVKSDTSFVDVINSKVRVHSTTNASSNKTVVDFTIPANTIKWTYWIGVGDESQEAFKKDENEFAKSASKMIGTLNPLAGLALGFITMSQSKVGDNVFYYFLSSYQDVQKFSTGQEFMQFKNGNVVTDFGLMNYPSSNNQKYFIGLSNDNLMDGINVNIKILAVVVKNQYESVVENVPTYFNKTIPVIED
jgi:hypothetical protein